MIKKIRKNTHLQCLRKRSCYTKKNVKKKEKNKTKRKTREKKIGERVEKKRRKLLLLYIKISDDYINISILMISILRNF
jgi:hypothetical protein